VKLIGHPSFPLRGKIIRRLGAAWSFVLSAKNDGSQDSVIAR